MVSNRSIVIAADILRRMLTIRYVICHHDAEGTAIPLAERATQGMGPLNGPQ